MPAELRADHVWLGDEAEASRLYNKGAFGLPQPGGALRLDFLEAAHLVEEGKLQVHRRDGGLLGLPELLALGARGDEGFETRWLASRDLRKRGYIVKASALREAAPSAGSTVDFHVYPRGGFPGKTPSAQHLVAVSERSTFDLEALLREAQEAKRLGKALLLAVVDEEGDLTYYDVTRPDPRGTVAVRARDLKGLAAEVLRDRAVLWDPQAAAELHQAEFLGRPLGEALQLSLTEAVWLAETHGLGLQDGLTGAPLRPLDLAQRAAAVQREFDLRHAAYRELRNRGLAVKTGFKYGTHFRAYAEDPEKAHAEFLAHALPAGFTCPWPDIAGVVRLAHSVRKTILFVSGTRLLQLERARP